jgi:hypothetical protein
LETARQRHKSNWTSKDGAEQQKRIGKIHEEKKNPQHEPASTGAAQSCIVTKQLWLKKLNHSAATGTNEVGWRNNSLCEHARSV